MTVFFGVGGWLLTSPIISISSSPSSLTGEIDWGDGAKSASDRGLWMEYSFGGWSKLAECNLGMDCCCLVKTGGSGGMQSKSWAVGNLRAGTNILFLRLFCTSMPRIEGDERGDRKELTVGQLDCWIRDRQYKIFQYVGYFSDFVPKLWNWFVWWSTTVNSKLPSFAIKLQTLDRSQIALSYLNFLMLFWPSKSVRLRLIFFFFGTSGGTSVFSSSGKRFLMGGCWKRWPFWKKM